MQTLKRLWRERPTLNSFLFLAAGMLIILYFSARHVGFSASQWAALALATLGLAALCIWIIGWETAESDDYESNEPES
ncbi:MAG: hypothetical protein HUU23_08555 [Caldilineales bacterium]|nr:hypothetical protein [Caldilineales bacterium]